MQKCIDLFLYFICFKFIKWIIVIENFCCIYRWSGRLWRSGVLFKPSLSKQSTLCLCTKTNWHTASQTTTCYNSIILWKNEISHRRWQPAKLCSTGNIQWKVRTIYCTFVAYIFLVHFVFMNSKDLFLNFTT